MNTRRPSPTLALLVVVAMAGVSSSTAAEGQAPTREAPKARPRLTDAARISAAEVARENAEAQITTLDKVEVRERRLPSGPERESGTVEKFSATGGGYLLKKEATGVTTELGLWRHISVIPHEDETRGGNTGIRMGFLRISW